MGLRGLNAAGGSSIGIFAGFLRVSALLRLGLIRDKARGAVPAVDTVLPGIAFAVDLYRACEVDLVAIDPAGECGRALLGGVRTVHAKGNRRAVDTAHVNLGWLGKARIVVQHLVVRRLLYGSLQ